jgi:hypothetical protein
VLAQEALNAALEDYKKRKGINKLWINLKHKRQN